MQATQAPLPAGESVLIGLAALAVVFVPFLWPLIDHFNTMTHEGTHAAVAALLGIPVLGILVNRDNAGATLTWGDRGLRRMLISVSGYLGPSAFGVGAASLISAGGSVEVLWIAMILLGLLMLPLLRSFGTLSVPAVIALLAYLLHSGDARTEVIAAYAVSWLLLLSGLRVAIQHGAGAGDAHILSELTRLPRRIWAVLWLSGTVAALLYGGKLLVLGA